MVERRRGGEVIRGRHREAEAIQMEDRATQTVEEAAHRIHRAQTAVEGIVAEDMVVEVMDAAVTTTCKTNSLNKRPLTRNFISQDLYIFAPLIPN
jgi:hypothetical protein